MNNLEFQGFPKMARLSREVIITEKLDGTNAQIFITEDGKIKAGSRTRWITPEDDNYGFAKWVKENEEELLKLGPGRHFGEWWGGGVQRKYGLQKDDKRLSLFNVTRWALHGQEPQIIPNNNPDITIYQQSLPECVGLVPLLYRGIFDTNVIDMIIDDLKVHGSKAVKGFMKPEGIVVFHIAGNIGFKKTILNDEIPKSKINK